MAEHTLVLLRHAKSDWSGGEADVDRPLAPRGRRQAPEAGRWLRAHLAPDLAVVSPARRARDTWEFVAGALGGDVRVDVDERVYAAAGNRLLSVVRSLPDAAGTVVLVGHNPGLEELVERLTGEWVALPTSALAVIDLTVPWAEAGESPGTLRASGRPPATGC